MAPSAAERTVTAAHLRQLRAALPPAAFQLNPRRAIGLVLWVLILGGAHAAVRLTGVSLWIVFPILIAVAMLSALSFGTHELAHGAVLRSGRTQRFLELLCWSPLLISPTVWRRVHNQTHHAHTNTVDDPDRRYFHEEATPLMRWYVRLFYPNAEMFPWNPLVFLHVGPYMARNTLSAYLPEGWKLPMVPTAIDYQPGDTRRIAREIAVMIAMQAAFFYLNGGTWLPYLVMMAATHALTSAISMGYIFTNHFNNPLTDDADPVRGSTSVIVPAWANWLHYNFSYHTEHHVFPAMNSDYYPQLSAELQKLYPGVYQRIPITVAWRRLWQSQPFISRPGAAEPASP